MTFRQESRNISFSPKFTIVFGYLKKMFKLLVLLFVIKLYARNKIFILILNFFSQNIIDGIN